MRKKVKGTLKEVGKKKKGKERMVERGIEIVRRE